MLQQKRGRQSGDCADQFCPMCLVLLRLDSQRNDSACGAKVFVQVIGGWLGDDAIHGYQATGGICQNKAFGQAAKRCQERVSPTSGSACNSVTWR
jgi:hypothetical protein